MLRSFVRICPILAGKSFSNCRYNLPKFQHYIIHQHSRHYNSVNFRTFKLNRFSCQQENLKKLKEETDKLEQSEALQKAREKYQLIEKETLKSSQVLKKQLEDLYGQLSKKLEEAKQTDLGRRGVELSENVAKTAREAAETLSKSAEALSANPAYKSVTEGMKTVKKEIDEITLAEARLYRKPLKLRKRENYAFKSSKRDVEPNSEATGMVLSKESQFYTKWKEFVDNNPYLNKLYEMKMKYDESDSRLARASKFFTDKVSDVVSSMFSRTGVSEVLTEIVKVDPSFDKEKFLRDCELEIIPNVLEASLSGELDILQDWCYQRAFATLSHHYTDATRAGYILKYHVLDIENVNLVGGSMTETGPVLLITFRAQIIRYFETPDGRVHGGNPDEIFLIDHVWALCRDLDELNPSAAWKVLEAVEQAPKPLFL